MVRRDVLLAWKRPGDVLNPLFFFAMVSTLFPLAVGPSPEQLQFAGPGIVWVAALLATLLSLNSLFLSDFEDGSLDQLILSPQPLPLLALGKSIAHWLTSGVPLVMVSPLVAISFRLGTDSIVVMMVTLALGTISLSMIGAIGAALTVGLHRGTALLSLLILPLSMPVLIFRRAHGRALGRQRCRRGRHILPRGLLHVGDKPRTIRDGCGPADQQRVTNDVEMVSQTGVTPAFLRAVGPHDPVVCGAGRAADRLRRSMSACSSRRRTTSRATRSGSSTCTCRRPTCR